MSDYDLKLPKGCRHASRSDGSTRILPPLAKIIEQPITARALTREEFEALTQKPPEMTIRQSKDVWEGKVKDQTAIESEYRGAYLLKMRDAAKRMTAQSGFSDEAIACWDVGIEALIAQVARFI